MKRCKTCNTYKPLELFARVHKGRVGAHCKSCAAAKVLAWKRRNPERHRRYLKEYYEQSRETVLATNLRWRAKNRRRLSDAALEYHRANVDAVAITHAAWYARNREYVKAKAKQWRAEHPDQVRATLSNLHAKRNAIPGRYSADDVQRLLEQQDKRCAACKTPLAENDYHVDHINPLSKGGTNWPTNLQILCIPCNLQKGRKTPERWRAFLAARKTA